MNQSIIYHSFQRLSFSLSFPLIVSLSPSLLPVDFFFFFLNEIIVLTSADMTLNEWVASGWPYLALTSGGSGGMKSELDREGRSVVGGMAEEEVE